MIYVLTLKRYAGATAPVRFTFIEDQRRSICALTEMFRRRETTDEINNCKTFHRDRRS
jgi:hypothetical protein